MFRSNSHNSNSNSNSQMFGNSQNVKYSNSLINIL